MRLATWFSAFFLLSSFFLVVPALAAVIPVDSDLVLWLRSDNVTTSGATVTGWQDLTNAVSGIGDATAQDAVLVNGGPTIQTGVVNGLDAVTFGGGGAYRYLGSLGISGSQAPFTGFIVGNDSSGGDANERAVQIGDVNGASPGGAAIGLDISSAGFRYNDGNRLFSGSKFDGNFRIGTWTMTNTDTYGTARYLLDGTIATQTGVTNFGNTTNIDDQGYVLGRGVSTSGGNSDWYGGQMAEFLLFNSALSATEQNRIGFYLQQRYGLTTAYSAPTEVFFDDLGTGSDWGTAANWDTAAEPIASQNVFINGDTTTATVTQSGEVAATLTIGSSNTGGLGAGTGELTITSGTLSVTNDVTLGDGAAGTLIVNGGTLDIGGALLDGGTASTVNLNGGTTTIAGNINAPTTLLEVDGGILNVGGSSITVNNFRIGQTAGDTGTFTLKSGQTLSTTNERLFIGDAGTGTFIQEAGSTVYVGSGSNQALVVGGNSASGQGTYTMEGGTTTVTGNLNIGNQTTATSLFTQQDGTVHANSSVQLGANGGTGQYDMQGGTLNVGLDLRIGGDGGSPEGTGIFNLSGGTVNVSADVDLGGPTGGANGTGTLNVTGGTLNITGNIIDGGNGTLVMNGPGLIDMSAGGGGNITVDTLYGNNTNAEIRLGNGLLEVRDSGGNAFAGQITGANGKLRKVSGGTLILSGASSYTGVTELQDGTTVIRNNLAFGNSSDIEMEIGDPILDIDANGLTLANSIFIRNEGNVKTIRLDRTGSNTATLSGDIRINEDSGAFFQVNVGPDDALTMSGNMITTAGGGAGLIKEGSGLLVLTGNNTYSGPTTVNAGTLRLKDNAIDSLSGRNYGPIAAGATLEFNRTIPGASNLGAIDITGGGTFLKTGGQSLQLTSSGAVVDMDATGLYHIAEGTFIFGGGTPGNWTTNLGDLQVDAGATFQGESTALYVDALDGGGNLTIGGNDFSSSSFNGPGLTVGVNDGSGIFSGTISNAGNGNQYSLVKVGTGTQVLSGVNTYTGPTTVQAGTLQIGDNATAATASITSPVTVSSGGTLAGTGSVNHSVNVSGTVSPGENAGSAIGTLHVGTTTEATTFNSGSILKIQLDPSTTLTTGDPGYFDPTGWQGVSTPTASDKLDVAGVLDLSGATLDLRDPLSSGWARGQEFNILDFDLALNDIDEDGMIDTAFEEYLIPYLYEDGYAVVTHDELVANQFFPDLGEVGEGIGGMLRWDFTDLYTQGIIRVIPEPGTWAIFAIGMFTLTFYWRRKK